MPQYAAHPPPVVNPEESAKSSNRIWSAYAIPGMADNNAENIIRPDSLFIATSHFWIIPPSITCRFIVIIQAITTPLDGVNVNALFERGYSCWEYLPMGWMCLIGKMFSEKWCGEEAGRSDHTAPLRHLRQRQPVQEEDDGDLEEEGGVRGGESVKGKGRLPRPLAIKLWWRYFLYWSPPILNIPMEVFL
jgi:hypothetical protein